MDTLTLAAILTTAVGMGTGLRWRRQARQAEAEASRLRRELLTERHAASHDPLTGLPNRRAFYQLGATLVAKPLRPHLAAAVLDLDNFKQINDEFGHAVGDEVLITVARRLADYAGDNLVARLGGDEFAGLLATHTTDQCWLNDTARHLAETLAAPIPVADYAVIVTASVGLVPVGSTVHLSEALRRADTAMYRAKTSRQHACRVSLDDLTCHRSVTPPAFARHSHPIANPG